MIVSVSYTIHVSKVIFFFQQNLSNVTRNETCILPSPGLEQVNRLLECRTQLHQKKRCMPCCMKTEQGNLLGKCCNAQTNSRTSSMSALSNSAYDIAGMLQWADILHFTMSKLTVGLLRLNYSSGRSSQAYVNIYSTNAFPSLFIA